jgi:hypothetical protein
LRPHLLLCSTMCTPRSQQHVPGEKQAFLHNNISVNENMHFQIALSILQNDECNQHQGEVALHLRCKGVYRTTANSSKKLKF